VTAAERYRPVARFVKPHGLKGEAVVFVLTEQADEVFVPGRTLTPVDAEGQPAAPAMTVERARPFHRRWLLKFRGVDERTPLEQWPPMVFAVPVTDAEEAREGPLRGDEVAGAAVIVEGREVGRARQLLDVPGGPLLVVDGEHGEHLVPYRPPILVTTDRVRREIVIDPPPGLLEL
jgi:16S rRNA processing protein RimM